VWTILLAASPVPYGCSREGLPPGSRPPRGPHVLEIEAKRIRTSLLLLRYMTRRLRAPSPRWSLPVALWAALALYMALIYSLSSAPLEDQGAAVAGAHEAVEGAVTAASGGDAAAGARRAPAVEHVLVYAGLGALALAAWSSLRLLPLGSVRARGWARAAWRWALPLAIALAVLYGLFDEWHQGYVSGRSSELADVAWDLAGAAVGGAMALVGRMVLVRHPRVRRWARAVAQAT